MIRKLLALYAGVCVAHALRAARHEPDGKLDPRPLSFKLMKTSEMVPHLLVDTHHTGNSARVGAEECLRRCQKDAECIGFQLHAETLATRGPSCMLRMTRVKKTNGTCLENYRELSADRGFAEVPLVPLAPDDGAVYMREDCMDSTVRRHGNTYWGFPWDWEQPGLSLSARQGFGESPLLDLVTPAVIDDLIGAGVPPWLDKKRPLPVDVRCEKRANLTETIQALRSTKRGQDGAAVIADLGSCICKLLSNGWDPRRELTSDIVLLLHRDLNFSPFSPLTDTARFATINTNVPCIKQKGGTISVFSDDVEAFTAMADNPHVLGIYLLQTPPITHEKVWVTPLGVDRRVSLPALVSRLAPGSLTRRRPRTALYDVSHNLGVDYRRTVFRVVLESFKNEPLHMRHLPWAAGARMDQIMQESFEAVFGQSPIGIGENCFRHSELLLAGTIPVVQGSLGIAALRYLPHLSVSDWHEVTPELLRNSYQGIWDRVRNGDFSFEPLTNSFWQRHIQDTAHGREVPAFYAKFPNPVVTCGNWNCTKLGEGGDGGGAGKPHSRQ